MKSYNPKHIKLKININIKSKQTKRNQTKLNEIESNQANSNQMKSNQTKTNIKLNNNINQTQANSKHTT